MGKTDDITFELSVPRDILGGDQQQLRMLLGQAALEKAREVLESGSKPTKGKKQAGT